MLMKTVVGATLALAITAAPVGTAPAKPTVSTAPLTEAAAQSVELPYETLGLCLGAIVKCQLLYSQKFPKPHPRRRQTTCKRGWGFNVLLVYP